MNNNHSIISLRSELLAVTVGKIDQTPVGIVTVRLNPAENLRSFNLSFDRPTLERLVEDVTSLLAKSPMLGEGDYQDPHLTLAEMNVVHSKLTE